MKKYYKHDVNCDYCGSKEKTASTNFGTTRYNRFICKECTEKYNKLDYTVKLED